MAPRRRQFQRPMGERRYRKMFVIAVEGIKTEPQYFELLNDDSSVIRVKCLKNIYGSSPQNVLKSMENYLKKEGLKASDEAWLVVDKDDWTDDQLSALLVWSQSQENYGFALSNPKFELWLLLHFEDAAGVANSRQCSERLYRHLPSYDKGIDSRKISRESILSAIQRAKIRDTPSCETWPLNVGTTVYRLVARILENQV